MTSYEALIIAVRTNGERVSHYVYEYSFDDWNAPLIRVRNRGVYRECPVYSVRINSHNEYISLFYMDDGELIEDDNLYDIADVNPIVEAIHNQE